MPATIQPTDSSVDALFQSDWDTAQQRYRAGVDAGYTAQDAEKLYLEPVRNKWDILKNVPVSMQPKAAADLGAAQLSFIKNVNSGFSIDDASNRVLAPAEEKWNAARNIRESARPDPLLDEKVGALQEATAGYNPMQVIQGHPRAIFSDPDFVTKFESASERGQKSRATEAARTAAATAKAKAADSPELLIKHLNELTNIAASPKFQALPQAVQASLANTAGAIENKLTNAPPDNLPTAPSGGGEKYATKYRSADEVKQAYRSKELTRDEATKILQDQFGLK